jgi:aminoglycoside phosphotransferase (APT) family kinase protein
MSEVTSPADRRQAPDSAFIEDIRRKFPVEREIDRMLTRKMQLRSGKGYTPLSLHELVAGAEKLIARNIASDFCISNARWLTGGASKIQIAFDFQATGMAATGGIDVLPMVLRMEPPESVVETSRLREFQLLQAIANIVPVPPCYWVDPQGECLPYPALIYGFVSGVTKPSSLHSAQVTGIGLNYGPGLREQLGTQFLEQVGRFHSAGPDIHAGMTYFDAAVVGSNESVIRQVNWWRRVWEEDRYEDEPLMEVAYRWLIRNAPPLDRVSIVHGDCRGGNFLFDEREARITCWLDWELGLLGDRHQDLAWSMMDPYRHMSEDGRTELISGFFPSSQYLDTYERLSGLSVDIKRLTYYRVLCSYLSVVICGGTGYRVARGGKTHQDVVVAWLAMISHTVMNQLRATLEELI